MSTEYFIVAEKDGDITIFDRLYKMQGFLGAFGDADIAIDKFIEDLKMPPVLGSRENMDEKAISLAFHLIHFIYAHQGYKFHLLDNNQILDFLYQFDKSKYPEEFWRQWKYYEPRY